jgi:hypothetical protein
MAVSFPSPRPVVTGVGLNRTRRTFSERDRLLLDLAYPHLLQAYRNAEAWARVTGRLEFSQSALKSSETAVIALASTGKVQVMTSKARLWIAKYFPESSVPSDGIPELVPAQATGESTAPTKDKGCRGEYAGRPGVIPDVRRYWCPPSRTAHERHA